MSFLSHVTVVKVKLALTIVYSLTNDKNLYSKPDRPGITQFL